MEQSEVEQIKKVTLLLLYICLIDENLRPCYVLNDIFSPQVIRFLERYHNIRKELAPDDFEVYIEVLSYQKSYNNEQVLKKVLQIARDFLPERGYEILQCLYEQKFFQQVLMTFNWFKNSIIQCFDEKTLYLVACAAYYSGELTIAKEYFSLLKKQGLLDKSLDNYLLWIENRQSGKEGGQW